MVHFAGAGYMSFCGFVFVVCRTGGISYLKLGKGICL